MKKYLIAMIGTALILMTSCSQEQATIQSSAAQATESEPQTTESEPQETADDITINTTETETEALDSRIVFDSENPAIKLSNLIIQEPMYEIVLDNQEKSYGKLVEEDYPQIEIESEEKFTAIGWWPDGNQVHLQFWNLNDESEITFTLDGEKCSLAFPASGSVKKTIDQTVESSENVYQLDSFSIYENSAVLNLRWQEKNSQYPDQFGLLVNGVLIPHGSWVYFGDEGSIKILYKIVEKGIEKPFTINGILCGEYQLVEMK